MKKTAGTFFSILIMETCMEVLNEMVDLINIHSSSVASSNSVRRIVLPKVSMTFRIKLLHKEGAHM